MNYSYSLEEEGLQRDQDEPWDKKVRKAHPLNKIKFPRQANVSNV